MKDSRWVLSEYQSTFFTKAAHSTQIKDHPAQARQPTSHKHLLAPTRLPICPHNALNAIVAQIDFHPVFDFRGNHHNPIERIPLQTHLTQVFWQVLEAKPTTEPVAAQAEPPETPREIRHVQRALQVVVTEKNILQRAG